MRRLGLLCDQATHPLAGRMTALLDLGSRLPIHVWFDEDAAAHDLAFWPRILSGLTAKALLIFDLGYTNFHHFADLTARQITFLTRAKKNLSCQVERVLHTGANVHDTLVWIGPADERQLIRLIEVLHRGLWYRYLTNELDDQRLPADIAVALYRQRWRIEDAYAIVKRLLGLAYFWSGSQNAIQLQLWATWILFAVLVDITDAVAAQLQHIQQLRQAYITDFMSARPRFVIQVTGKNKPWIEGYDTTHEFPEFKVILDRDYEVVYQEESFQIYELYSGSTAITKSIDRD